MAGSMARTKGQNGEREVAAELNDIIMDVMRKKGFPEATVESARYAVQRNQNQSAVGGSDLTNTLGLCIEIKRQEAISIPAWWRQCVAAANRNSETPVLLYRQNRKPWRCVTWAYTLTPQRQLHGSMAEISWEDFLSWFRRIVEEHLDSGKPIRI